MNSFFVPPVPLNLSVSRSGMGDESASLANEELKRLLTVNPENLQPKTVPVTEPSSSFPSETLQFSAPSRLPEPNSIDLQATLAAITFQQTLMAQQLASGSGAMPVLPTYPLSPPLSDPSQNMLAKALISTTSRRSRSEKKPIPDELKDSKYFERRKRNNLAAKKSRDARKMREDQVKKLVAIRASYLEHENSMLKTQVSTLREEAMSLRQLWIQKKNNAIKRDQE